MTIMGFHVSHVWKTTDAGASWTDFSASLPDAPANAVLLDASANTVYVGTDVGVFASGTASPVWTEVGPAPASEQAGYLPNVAVTALRMFNSGGTRKLRASTYGRGIWEFTLASGPDFQFASPDNDLTAFAGQNAAFTATLLAQNGFTNSVNLTCTRRATAPPPTCTVTPASVTPTSSGATFSVTAGGPGGRLLVQRSRRRQRRQYHHPRFLLYSARRGLQSGYARAGQPDRESVQHFRARGV